jgi:hypothetical protein
MYEAGHKLDDLSYMDIYETAHGICSEQCSIVDEGADLILSSVFCALPLLQEERLSFSEVLEDDGWLLTSDMVVKNEFYKHHLQVVSRAIQRARSAGVAIHTISLLHFELPFYNSWEEPSQGPLSESLRQLLKNVNVLRLCEVSERVLEVLSHCTFDLHQLDLCGVVAPEKVIKDFFETNKKSIRSIGFHDVGILGNPGLNRLYSSWNATLQTLEGHSDRVNSVALSHDSKLLASASSDKTVQIWDAATGTQQHTLKGHIHEIKLVAFSHNSKLLASASRDMSVRIWDVATGTLQQTISVNDQINSLFFDISDVVLITNIGRIKLREPELVSLSEDSQEGGKIDRKGLAICETWVTWNAQNLLWLPPGYWAICFGISLSGSTVAIGCKSGKVIVIGFSLAILQILDGY